VTEPVAGAEHNGTPLDADEPPAEDPGRSPLAIAAAAVIVMAGAVAYHNSFDGAFVFDDLPAIRDNATLRSLWPPGAALSPPDDSGVGGRPLANLSFALNRAMGGDGVASYHAGNLLLHLGGALLLFGLVRRTQVFFGARQYALPLAFTTALLWVIHPLTTATVSWLSQRTELLMAFCYLATLYAFLRGTETSRPRWLVLSVTTCALGMMSKEVMVTAPVLVLLYDRTFVAGTFRAAWAQRSRYYLALAATWLVLGALLASSGIGQRSVGFGLGVSPLTYALTESRALLLYLKLAVWPSPLVFDYGALYGGHVVVAGASAGLVLAALAWTLRALHRHAALGFAAGCFFLLLAPTSSVVPVAEQPLAENRMYLPLAVVLATFVTAVFLATGTRLRKALPACATAFCILVLARNVDYRSGISLWTDTVTKRPQNPRAQFNLGVVLLDAGRAAEAVTRFEQAVALKPGDARAQHSLGNALLELNRTSEALPRFAEAVRLAPRYARAWYNYGRAQLRQGDHAGALESMNHARHLQPGWAEAHHASGNAYFAMNQPRDAIGHYEAALRLDPTLADAHYSAGSACFELARFDDAIAHFTAAARLKPMGAEIRNNLGAALLRGGRANDAITAFEHALRLKPDYADARDNLAVARAEAARAK